MTFANRSLSGGLTLPPAGDAPRLLLIFTLFTLVLPTAWSSIALGLFLIAWFASGNLAEKFQRIRLNPVAISPILLFLLILAGSLYSSGSAADIADQLYRYAKLLYIPLIIAILDTEKWRQRAIQAFLLGMALSLLLSYLEFAGAIPPDWLKHRNTGFKNHIAYSFMLSYAIYLLAERYLEKRQWSWGLMTILALANMFLVNLGRTGQLLTLCLLFYLSLRRWGWKVGILALAGGAVLLVALFQFSAGFHSRVMQAADQIAFQIAPPADPALVKRESGKRLFMHTQSIKLIQENPVLGTGTGSLNTEYARLIGDRDLAITENPHNEYLNLGIQLGLIGLTAFLGLLAHQWFYSTKLASPWQGRQQALLITMGVGCVFNSLLMDHIEGHFFVLMAGVFLSSLAPDKHST